MEHRVLKMKDIKLREDGGKRYLEGYFSVFGEQYEVYPGWIETIMPGAFSKYLASGADTKVLWNHDTNIVLGSTANRTATLKEDSIGLYGSVEVNENDQDALNAYARVSRGDVDGCSFGFDIREQKEWWGEDGVYYTQIMEVDPLYEVSPCTFPAYTSTSISARNSESLEDAKKRFVAEKSKKLDEWRKKCRMRMKGVN